MSAKNSFLISVRIFFILFSIPFIKNAFYKWDGYSYYIRFIDFLPDLSLAFILWTIPGIIIAFVFWLLIYGFINIIPKPLRFIQFEHIMLWFIFIVFVTAIKRTFFNISLTDLFKLNHSIILLIGFSLAIILLWVAHKYVNFEKILNEINIRITPVVWLFVLLLILAVPFSFKSPQPPFTKGGQGGISAKEEGLPKQSRPNIILVTMDALTAHDMQVYGYNRPTTPFISEWSKDAVIFARAYATSCWTTPTSMSLMTGQRPWTHKRWHYVDQYPAGNYENNLAKVLRDYGYTNYALIQNLHPYPEQLGIKNVFSNKDKPQTFSNIMPRREIFYKLTKFLKNRPVVQDWIISHPVLERIFSDSDRHITLHPPEKVYNRFFSYISQNSEEPFFAWLHVLPPHDPYLPPEPYMSVFGDSKKFNSLKKQKGHFIFDGEYKSEAQGEIDILRKRYDEFILYSDQQFKLFLERLTKVIDISNTIFILSADHGESFSHNFLGHHGFHLYEPIVHIPLIIKIPDKKKKVLIDVPISQIDIAPTILELAGIPVPEWMEGRSLVPLLKGKSLEPRPIFSMQLIKNRVIGNPPIAKGTFAVWDGGYKLIYYLSETRSEEDKKILLFNLKSDPDEMKDISREKPEITQRLMKLIENELSRANARIIQSRGK